jgi:mRNA-degrading endonuclease RelE of RelBE toxin-antitoxin system
MEFEQSAEFRKDLKKLPADEVERLDRVIASLAVNKRAGKQLHHLKEVYSVRIGNKRLVYRIEGEERILLVLFRSREGVYGLLK